MGWVDAMALIARVARAYEVSPEELLGPSRLPYLVEGRRVVMALLHEHGLGASAIGHLIGRDHSTVVHHLKMMKSALTWEEREMLTRLRRELAQSRQAAGAHGGGSSS